MVEYNDEDLLMLSGIQHIAFCERQWALIHVEQQWVENRLTVEGNHLHAIVDDPLMMNQRNNIVTLRSVSLISRKLGFYGYSDVVEMHKSETSENSIVHPDYKGFWTLYPIEYKRGKPKKNEIDEVQLCAQAMCLEEMYNLCIREGCLYYGETRRREVVIFDLDLRSKVEEYSKMMHYLYKNAITPLPKYKSHCKSCSLYDICLPKYLTKPKSVSAYFTKIFD